MPRKVRDASLETRTARGKLKVRHKPYYRLIEPGLHLGYRKLPSGPGTWVARRYAGNGRYVVENIRAVDNAVTLADDYADADGVGILSFAQAQQKARVVRKKAGALTVSGVLDDYLELMERQGRSQHSIASTRYRVDALIRPQLGEIRIGALTAKRLRDWQSEIANKPSRFRFAKDDDAMRARRASANRVWGILRAALNAAYKHDQIESNAAWAKIAPFEKVDAARVRYLSVSEAQRLVNASDAEFRPLVQVALHTGARYGELANLKVRDFNPDVGTVAVWQSKSGKPRHIVLTDEGMALFRQLTAGKSGDALILSRYSGQPWGRAHQWQPMDKAVKRAKIAPAISFHGLRHTWASLAIMAGVPPMVVAKNLGHSDTRMVEKHYGHLAPSYVADAIRKGAPKFGFESDNKVTAVGRLSS
jgi:integrase